MRLKNSYDDDYFGWTHRQAECLRLGIFKEIDVENLIEEIQSLGNSELSKFESYLCLLLLHLLKIRYQPEKHTRSWDLSIKNARFHCLKLIKKNPSFKSKLKETFDDAYMSARIGAAIETKIDETIFPEVCPWTIDEVLESKK